MLSLFNTDSQISPPPAPRTQHSSFCLSVWFLPTLGISFKWNHSVLVLLWVAYFTEHSVLQIHPCCGVCQSVLPLKGWMIFRCMYFHFLFTRFSMNKVAMNMDAQCLLSRSGHTGSGEVHMAWEKGKLHLVQDEPWLPSWCFSVLYKLMCSLSSLKIQGVCHLTVLPVGNCD